MKIYKCNTCGKIVEVLHAGVGTLVCCDQPMTLQEEKSNEIGQEKHLPVIEKSADGVSIKIGSVPHPMEKVHYIEWVELLANDRAYRIFLHPGNDPKADFNVKMAEIGARAYCNVHGLWKTDISKA